MIPGLGRGPTLFEPVATVAEFVEWNRVSYRFIGEQPESGGVFFRVRAE